MFNGIKSRVSKITGVPKDKINRVVFDLNFETNTHRIELPEINKAGNLPPDVVTEFGELIREKTSNALSKGGFPESKLIRAIIDMQINAEGNFSQRSDIGFLFNGERKATVITDLI